MPETALQLPLIERDTTLHRWARLSPCGTWRYLLGRSWADGPRVLWVGLNPSTADAEVDDPTVRRMVGFSKGWGYGSLELVNLYSVRATDPRELLGMGHAERVGPDAEYELLCAVERAALVVVCWGGHRAVDPDQVRRLLWLIGGKACIVCLGTTKAGAPRHPLYLPKNTPRVGWTP